MQKLVHHNSGKVIYNSQNIADAFTEYYEVLYNLKDDKNTPQPLDIAQFLNEIHLPTIDSSTLLKG